MQMDRSEEIRIEYNCDCIAGWSICPKLFLQMLLRCNNGYLFIYWYFDIIHIGINNNLKQL
jgi:hypothetical protein